MINNKYFQSSSSFHNYRKFSNASETSQETLDRKITERAQLRTRNGAIDARLIVLKASYDSWVADGSPAAWVKANERSAEMTTLQGERAANVSTIAQLDIDIAALQQRVAAELAEKQAANLAALADANLTPEQRAILEKQRAELQLKQEQLAAQSKLEEQKAIMSSKNKRIIIISGISLAVLITLAIVAKILKNRKKGAE